MIFLSGIKPTGEMHLGNYVSLVQPIRSFLDAGNIGYLFVADGHALTVRPEPTQLKVDTVKLLAGLISFFKRDIENSKLYIYMQSMFPEIFEMSYLLAPFCSVGLLNRCHTYKVMKQTNVQNCKDPDYNINIFIKLYPLLMASDILILDADIVPVGLDQMQHMEIAQEVARVCNNFLKKNILKVPQAHIQTEVVLPGLDGRKMSKSYKNTIQVFEDPKRLKKLINSIPTNFKNVGEAKFHNESDVTEIYKYLATEEEFELLLDKMKSGIGWGEVKTELYNKILDLTKDAQLIYTDLVNNPLKISSIISTGEAHVRVQISNKLHKVKEALGLWN